MTSFARWRMVLSAGLALFLLPFGAAWAACSDFGQLSAGDLRGEDIGQIQAGLRAAYSDEAALLNDGIFGAYTASKLESLCQEYPRAEDTDATRTTIDLALDLGVSAREAETVLGWREPEQVWTDFLWDGSLKAAIVDDRVMLLRLAALPESALATIAGLKDTSYCAGLSDEEPPGDDAQLAMNVMADLGVANTTLEFCTTFVTLPYLEADASSLDFFYTSLDRLGRFERLYPGALAELLSDEFQNFYQTDRDRVLLSLSTTEPVLFALYERYLAQKVVPTPTPAEPTEPEDVPVTECPTPDTASATSYISFTEQDLELLAAPPSVAKVLEGLTGEDFGSSARMWEVAKPQLAAVMSECALAQVEALLPLGLSFDLNLDLAARTGGDADLDAMKPVIAGLVTRGAATRDDLEANLRRVFTESFLETELATVELAADTLAAASVPAAPITDTAIDGFPEGTPLPDTGQPLAVTDDTDRAVADTIPAATGGAYVAALRSSQFPPAAKAEMLKADVRRVLRPIAEDIAAKKAESVLKQIGLSIGPRWSMNTRLQEAIQSNPNVFNFSDSSEIDGLADRMQSLVGLEYRTARLFRDALSVVPPEQGAPKDTPPGISAPLAEKATQLALTHQPDREERFWAPFASNNMCVPPRGPSALVYSFYPYWMAPNVKEELPVKVDFGTYARLGFYGVEMRLEEQVNGNKRIVTPNLQRWEEAKAVFTETAHRYRAKVDLTFEVYDWQDWNDNHIAAAQSVLREQLDDDDILASLSEGGWAQAIPNLFDEREPDGVTLIFNGPEGASFETVDMVQMAKVIDQLAAALPEPDTQTLNVAFDFGMFEVSDDYFLPHQFRDVLLAGRQSDQAELAGWDESEITEEIRVQRPKVSKILVFLPRKTTDSKKALRAWLERGDFQGKVRADLLRSVIPVVPAAAHQFVETRAQPEDPSDKEFSQFVDDLIYFEDNFSGVGFWPQPLKGDVNTAQIAEKIALGWNADPLPGWLGFALPWRDRLCHYTCANRGYVLLIAGVIALGVAGLAWRAFYTGAANTLAYGLAYGRGFYWLGNGVIIAALLALTLCDAVSSTPPKLLMAHLVLLALFQVLLRRSEAPEVRP